MTAIHARTSICASCGAPLFPADRFCSKCGAKAQLAQQLHSEASEEISTAERRRLSGADWQPDQGDRDHDISGIEWTTTPATNPKKRHRHRQRHRLLNVLAPLTVAIAIVLGGLGGFAISETGSTINKLQQVSTPPAQITDQTVHTGQSGDSSQPETAASAANSEEQSNSPADGLAQGSIGAENDGSGTGSTTGEPPANMIDAPQVTSDPSTQDILIELPAEPDTPKDTKPTNPVSSAGSAPTNSSDDSISASEGEPVDGETLAEQQMAAGKTFDTAPAQTAILQDQQESGNDPGPSTSDGGFLGDIRDRGSDIRDTAKGAAIAAGISESDSEPLTIMIMGVDAREGSPIDIGVRPDALMVLRLDPVAGTCKGLAIPRDSWVELPGYGKTKINHALMLGGIPYHQLVVENYLGIDIDHYALIDFTGFAELVDSVGGVTIDVPPELESPAVSAGTVAISGEQALRHARYRGGPDGDFGRIKRQQQIMRGLIAAAGGRDLLGEANRLLSGLQDHVRTDLDIDELVSLAKFYQDKCGVDGLNMNQIPGEVVYGPLIDPLFDLPLSYVVSDPAVVRELVSALLDE